MLMKRFVGRGDDWRIHIDVMVMVFQGCPLINLPASPSAYNATTNQRLEQQRWAVVVVAMATATAVGTTATMVAAAVAKTTAATARQQQRRQRGPLLAKLDVGVSKQGSKRQTCVCQADVSQTCWPTCRQHDTKSCRPGYRADMTQHVTC
jgi:hypothetical protein